MQKMTRKFENLKTAFFQIQQVIVNRLSSVKEGKRVQDWLRIKFKHLIFRTNLLQGDLMAIF